MCEHVKKVEDDYWVKDGLIEDAMEEFVIRLDSDTEDEEFEDDYAGNDTDDNDLSDDEYDKRLLDNDEHRQEQALEEEILLKIMHTPY